MVYKYFSKRSKQYISISRSFHFCPITVVETDFLTLWRVSETQKQCTRDNSIWGRVEHALLMNDRGRRLLAMGAVPESVSCRESPSLLLTRGWENGLNHEAWDESIGPAYGFWEPSYSIGGSNHHMDFLNHHIALGGASSSYMDLINLTLEQTLI